MSLVTDILYTLIYIAIMATLFGVHLRKNEGRWGVGTYTLLSFLIYPIIGIFWFFNPNTPYGETVPLRLWPFIYLAIMEWIALRPVLQYDRNNITRIAPPSMLLLNGFAVIFILCALMQIPQIIHNMADGLRTIVSDTMAGSDIYADSQKAEGSYDGAISNIPSIIFNVFSPLAFILFFYCLSLGKKYIWAALGFLVCVLIKSFHSLSNGQRTEVTMSVVNLFVAYMALLPMLSQRLKRILRMALVVLAIGIAIPFVALTISRFGDRDGGIAGGIIYYAGEAPYYFNDYALDAGGTRNGDRTCNVFKKLIGRPAPNGIFEVRDAYPDLKMDDSVFSTFVGDFVLDFGAGKAALLFIVFSILFCRLTRPDEPNQLPFHRLILVYFAMSVCMQGGFYLFNYSFEGNLQILAIALFYGIFCLDYRLRQKPGKEVAQ